MKLVHARTALVAGSLAFAGCNSPSGSTSNTPSPGRITTASLEQTRSQAVAPKAAHVAGRSVDGPRDEESLRRARARAHKHKHNGPGKAGSVETPAVISGGTPFIAAPKVVPVIFPGNDLDAQVRQFFASLPGNAWWQATMTEYGVGAITLLPVYVPTDPLPTLATVDQWIADLAASAPPGLPAPDDNTIYAVVLPLGWQQAEGACVSFGAYHSWNYTSTGQVVVHTVNPTCDIPYLGLTGINDLTFALSHEIAESASDPTGESWISVNWAASAWATAGEGTIGAELADMCEFQPEASYTDPQSGFQVTRMWSNAQAAAGHDPCLPLQPGAGPYFTADPVPPDGTQAEPYAYTSGVSIPPGGEVTIPVVLRSDGPVGEWQLSAEEQPNPHLLPDVYNELSFSWDKASGRAGDTRYLTIKRSPPPDGGSVVFLRVAINSTLGAVVHTSWLVVGTELAQQSSLIPVAEL